MVTDLLTIILTIAIFAVSFMVCLLFFYFECDSMQNIYEWPHLIKFASTNYFTFEYTNIRDINLSASKVVL